ncbi:hypothetical protein Taro_031697, partial [Colocasia esculenta]|nr:hypothetical protein [Colocasia esculenta]
MATDASRLGDALVSCRGFPMRQSSVSWRACGSHPSSPSRLAVVPGQRATIVFCRVVLSGRLMPVRVVGRSVAFWLPKVKSLGWRSPSLSFFPLPLPPAVLRLPLSPSCVSGEEEGRAWCCGVVDLAWSEEEVAVRREGPSWVRFFVTGSRCVPPYWCRDGSVRRNIRGGIGPLGRDLIATWLAVEIRLSRRASWSRQDCCRGAFLPGRNRAIAVPFPVTMVSRRPWGRDSTYVASVRRGFVVLPRLFAWCLALEGLSCSEVVSISWDPRPREPVEVVLQATSVLELAAHVWDAEGFGVLSWRRPDSPLSYCLSLHWIWSHVVVSGVRPQLGWAAVLRVLCVSVAALSRPCAGAETRASGGSRFGVLLVLWSHSWVLARDGTDVCSFPTWRCVRGPRCAKHYFRFVPDSVVLDALAGEGLVIPTGPCSRGSPPYFFQLGARRRGSSVSDGLQRRLWRRVLSAAVRASIVSSCSLSELRAVFCKSSGSVGGDENFGPWLQLLLCRMRGECGRSACSCRSGTVGAALAGSGLPYVKDACEPVQAEVHRLVALFSGGGFLELFVVVLVSVSAVALAGAFWRVFPERCLGGSGGGSPRTGLRSSQDRPLSLLAEVLPRSALYSFRATIVLPLWFEVCRLVGLRSDGGLVSVVVLGWLCFIWKCQSRVVVLPLAFGRDSCVSPSSDFRQLLEVVVLHYGVVLPGCTSLVEADVACCTLSGLWFLACGFRTVCSCSSVSVLCRLEPWCIVLYPEWVAGCWVTIVRSVGDCNCEDSGWRFLLFGPDLASLGTWGCRSVWAPNVCLEVAGVSVRLVALSRLPWRARSYRGPLTRRVKVCNTTGRSVAFQLLKVKSLGRRSPSLSFFPLPLPPAVLRLPLSPSCVSGEEEGCAWCCGIVDLAWSEEEVAVRREGPSRLGIEDPVGLPPCWCRDGSARRNIRGGVSPLGHDLVATRLVVAIRLSRLTEGYTFVAVSWQRYQEGRPFVRALVGRRPLLRVRVCLSLARLVVCYKPAVWRGFVVLPRLFARCLALEGLSRSEVVSVSWDPRPWEPVEGVLRATSVLELAVHVWDAEGFGVLSWRRPDSPLSHCLSLRWFRSHVVVLGVRPQLGQAAVCAEHCFRFVPDSVGFYGSRVCAKTLLGARHHGSSVSDGLQRRLWRRVLSAAVRASVVSSCSLSELRAVFCESS